MLTADKIIDMVYMVPAQSRTISVFVCDHKTANELRKILDGDGRHIWRSGLSSNDVPRLLGYPVYPDKRRAGLAFGEFVPLPDIREFHTYSKDGPQ